jgi:hypothetical protein
LQVRRRDGTHQVAVREKKSKWQCHADVMLKENPDTGESWEKTVKVGREATGASRSGGPSVTETRRRWGNGCPHRDYQTCVVSRKLV